MGSNAGDLFNAKDDQFKQQGVGWIHNIGGEKDIPIETLATRLNLDSIQAGRNFKLISALIEMLCKQQSANFLKTKWQVECLVEDLLERKTFTEKTSFTLSELIKFYAHLTSTYMDLQFQIPSNSQEDYFEHGLINNMGETTPYFREQLPFLALQEAQSQLEGMQPERAIQLFYSVLKSISQNKNHTSSNVASRLQSILQKTLYLKKMAEEAKNSAILPTEKQKRLSSELLKQPVGSEENILMHSGHHQHSFYVGIKVITIKEKITVRFIINNFNTTAIKYNKQTNKDENDFHPFVLKMEIPRLEAHSNKGKIRKKFDEEEKQLAFYLSLLQYSSIEGNYFVTKCSQKKLFGVQKKVLFQFKKIIIKNSDRIFQNIHSNNINAEGFFR